MQQGGRFKTLDKNNGRGIIFISDVVADHLYKSDTCSDLWLQKVMPARKY